LEDETQRYENREMTNFVAEKKQQQHK